MSRQQYSVPTDVGQFENGCFTLNGCDLCLYAQTTRYLYEDRQHLFETLLTQKRAWKGMSEFSVPMRLQQSSKSLFVKACDCYDAEILGNKSYLDRRDTAFDGKGGVVDVFNDFVGWLVREFDAFETDRIAVEGEAA